MLQVLSVLYLVFFLKPVAEFKSNESQNNNLLCESLKDGLNLEGMSGNEKSLARPPGFNTNELHPLTNEEHLVSGAQPRDIEEKEDLVSVCEHDTEERESLVPVCGNDMKERQGLVSVYENEDVREKRIEDGTSQPTLLCRSQKMMMCKLVLEKVPNPVTNFKAMIFALNKLKHKKISFSLLLALCFCLIAFFGEQSIIIFYVKSKPFYMGARDVGFFLAYQSATIAVVGHGLLNLIVEKCLKISEARLLVLFAIAGVIFQTLVGVSTSTLMLYCIQVFNAIFNLSVPNIRSLISKMADHDSVGTVIGGVIVVENLAMLIASFIIPFTYAGLLTIFRGAAFFLLAAILFATFVIAVLCAKHLQEDTEAGRIEEKN